MKKTLFLLTCALVTLSFARAQKIVYGDNVQKREISSFHAIQTSSGIEVIITKGDKPELAVSVEDNEYLQAVRTVVENGTLKISRSGDWKLWRKWKSWKAKVYVSYTDLDEVRANSGGSVKGTDVKLDKLFASMNSGGYITLTGTVGDLTVEGSSGAQFGGYSLNVTNCHASTNSGAGIHVTVAKEISAKASSGGFIRYKGEALIRDINVNSGGSVKRQG